MRWKIGDSHECNICGEIQTIEHLLHSCVYVRNLWQIVELFFEVDINFKHILGLDEQFEHDDIITIVSFLIYKDWLLPSLQNKDRNSVIALSYFKAELTLRQRIYEECRSIEVAHIDKMKKTYCEFVSAKVFLI